LSHIQGLGKRKLNSCTRIDWKKDGFLAVHLPLVEEEQSSRRGCLDWGGRQKSERPRKPSAEPQDNLNTSLKAGTQFSQRRKGESYTPRKSFKRDANGGERLYRGKREPTTAASRDRLGKRKQEEEDAALRSRTLCTSEEQTARNARARGGGASRTTGAANNLRKRTSPHQ